MLRITASSQRAFNSLEIRKLIFEALASRNKEGLVACAQVCSTWSETALDELWRDLESIQPVLEVLGLYFDDDILSRRSRGYLTTSTDWRRLTKYSGRVKRLVFENHDVKKFDKHEDVLEEIITLKSGSLLPNLEELDLPFASPKYLRRLLLLFLGKKLTRLSVGFFDRPEHEAHLSPFVGSVVNNCQGLTSFTIRRDERQYSGTVHIERDLIRLFSRSRKLKTVNLPLYDLSPKMLDVLSQLPDLRSISSKNTGCSRTCQTLKFDDLKPFAFKSLVALEICGTFENLTYLLVNGHFASKLLHLNIHSTELEDTQSIHSVVEEIARHCHKLRTLGLMAISPQLCSSTSTRLEIINDCIARRRVSQHTLNPLICLSHLKSFTITWPCPLEISNSDLILLVKKMASIEELDLNCCPFVHGRLLTCNLDLMILPQIAEHCPNIQHLGLFVGSKGVPTGPYTQPIRPLAHLKSLNLGLSYASKDYKPLATFLSKVCPSTCSFPDWPRGVQTSQKLGNLDRRWIGRCTDIGEVISHLAKAREEEREISGRIIWEWQMHSQCLEKKFEEERSGADAKVAELQRRIDELEARIAKGSSLRPKAKPTPRRSLRRKSTV